MKTIILSILALSILAGCGDPAVNIVKSASFGEGVTVEQAVAGIAGVEGKIRWEGYHSDSLPHYAKAVNAIIETNHRTAEIQWAVNTDTKFVKLNAIQIDGEQKPLIVGMMELNVLATTPKKEKPKIEDKFECYIQDSAGKCVVEKEVYGNVFKFTDERGLVTYTNMNKWGKSNVNEHSASAQ